MVMSVQRKENLFAPSFVVTEPLCNAFFRVLFLGHPWVSEKLSEPIRD